MKRFLGLLFLTAFLSVLNSCSDNDEPEPERQTEKTIFLYMPWSSNDGGNDGNSLYDAFIDNIEDIEAGIKAQGGLHDNKLMVFIAETSSRSALLEICFKGNKCVRDTLKRYNHYDYTAPEGLAGILRDVQSYAPAPIYDMLIGCHGQGWIPKNVYNYYRSRAFGGSVAKYQMEISDLAQAIGMAGMHMQFISFDDCYMAGIEVAYDLKDVADYLIASTSEIMAAGLPYARIWKHISPKEPNYEGICRDFLNYYSSTNTPWGTLAVINLKEVESMADIMSQINSRFTPEAELTDDVQKLDGFAQTVFFDFEDYINKLCTDGNMKQTAVERLNKLVPYKVNTPQIFTAYKWVNGGFDKVPVNTFSGITVSDLTQNSYVASHKTTTAWWKATH